MARGPKEPGPKGMKPGMKIENPGKLFVRLMKYIFKYYWLHCIIVVIGIVVSVFATNQGTMFTQTLIDKYILPLSQSSNPDFSKLFAKITEVGAFYAAGVVGVFLYNRLMIYVTQGTLKRLRIEMFNKMETLPIKYFDTHAHGDIMSLYTNDIDTLRQMISQSIPQAISSAITVVSVFIYMLILNVPLTVLTIAMVGVTLVVTKKLGGLSGSYFMAQQRDIGKLNGYVEEMMEGQKVVKVFCHEEESKEGFDKLNDQLFDSANNANKFANILMPINAQLGNISYVLCAMVGGILALNGVGGFTIGALVSFLTFNKSFSMPVNQMSQQFNSIVMALAGADRIFKILDEEPEVDDGYVELVNAKEDANGDITETEEHTGMWAWKHFHKDDGTTTYAHMRGDIVFDHVDFGYNDDKMILHDIVLYAKPGQKIAFVGATGAGKTTITNLINRFYDIQDGKIRYDGINVNKIKKNDLRRSLGIVLQDTHLFKIGRAHV